MEESKHDFEILNDGSIRIKHFAFSTKEKIGKGNYS